MVLGKGLTLVLLREQLRLSTVPSFILIDLDEWRVSETSTLDWICNTFTDTALAIRSSAGNEDGMSASGAGMFHSELNIPSSNRTSISDAINSVIESYGKSTESLFGATVIIQEMVSDVSVSGVVLTQHMSTSAPYYVVNYDDISKDTSSVTSGKTSDSNRTLFIHRNHLEQLRSERFMQLIIAVQEIENVLNNSALDIEFVLDSSNKVHILQARPISNFIALDPLITQKIEDTLIETSSELRELSELSSNQLGRSTIWGQMPDWNPAEMIGEVPKKLAFSMYSTLITDKAWWEARCLMGYKVPSDKRLMHSFAGHPYINVRSSLQSYLPACLSDLNADKIIKIWLKALRDDPKKHDKLEFEVAVSGYAFDLVNQIERSMGESIDLDLRDKIFDSILEQTRDILANGSFTSLYEAMRSARSCASLEIALDFANMKVLKNEIDDCIKFGTVPFAVAARHAFIAKNILYSMVRVNAISHEELELFTRSIETVATGYTDDLHSLNGKEIEFETFMSKYGHLRPGTYDICSQRYDQLDDPLTILNGPNQTKSDYTDKTWVPSQAILNKVDALLIRDGLPINATDLFSYIKDAIVGREECKFLFTKRLSGIMEQIASYGRIVNLNRETLSNVDLKTILLSGDTSDSVNKTELFRVAEANILEYHIHMNIRMPELIFDPTAVFVVPFQVGRPNFVSKERITAPIVKLEPTNFGEVRNLEGHIILIDNADPGFDWIFGHNIRGLVTKFGGINSHMTIRCAELGLPAAIGCGFQLFSRIEHANVINLDCESRLINVVS